MTLSKMAMWVRLALLRDSRHAWPPCGLSMLTPLLHRYPAPGYCKFHPCPAHQVPRHKRTIVCVFIVSLLIRTQFPWIPINAVSVPSYIDFKNNELYFLEITRNRVPQNVVEQNTNILGGAIVAF